MPVIAAERGLLRMLDQRGARPHRSGDQGVDRLGAVDVVGEGNSDVATCVPGRPMSSRNVSASNRPNTVPGAVWKKMISPGTSSRASTRARRSRTRALHRDPAVASVTKWMCWSMLGSLAPFPAMCRKRRKPPETPVP